jgi:hypothetical protein
VVVAALAGGGFGTTVTAGEGPPPLLCVSGRPAPGPGP